MLAFAAETWTALAAWATAIVAIGTAGVAIRQLSEARKTRREQAQPYVMVFLESNVSPDFIDLVVKNFGKTAAHSVRLSFDPAPMRSDDAGGTQPVIYPDEIPTLAPGQEWRTFWDQDMLRKRAELPNRYDVAVTYTDSAGGQFTMLSRLDWGVYDGTHWVGKKTVHHIGKSVEKIAKTIDKWSEFHGGLAVVARDGDAKDERRANQIAELRAERAAEASHTGSDS